MGGMVAAVEMDILEETVSMVFQEATVPVEETVWMEVTGPALSLMVKTGKMVKTEKMVKMVEMEKMVEMVGTAEMVEMAGTVGTAVLSLLNTILLEF